MTSLFSSYTSLYLCTLLHHPPTRPLLSDLPSFLKKFTPVLIASNSHKTPCFSPCVAFSYSCFKTILRPKFRHSKNVYLKISLKVLRYNGRIIRILEVIFTIWFTNSRVTRSTGWFVGHCPHSSKSLHGISMMLLCHGGLSSFSVSGLTCCSILFSLKWPTVLGSPLCSLGEVVFWPAFPNVVCAVSSRACLHVCKMPSDWTRSISICLLFS